MTLYKKKGLKKNSDWITSKLPAASHSYARRGFTQSAGIVLSCATPGVTYSSKSLQYKKEHFVSRAALKCYSAWLCQMRTVKESSLYLFGQQLLAQCVKCDKLPRQHPRVYEALGHQHDFTDQLEVWYHHGARSVGGGGYTKKKKKIKGA